MKFRHWRAPRWARNYASMFHYDANSGRVTVREAGLYFVYSQVTRCCVELFLSLYNRTHALTIIYVLLLCLLYLLLFILRSVDGCVRSPALEPTTWVLVYSLTVPPTVRPYRLCFHSKASHTSWNGTYCQNDCVNASSVNMFLVLPFTLVFTRFSTSVFVSVKCSPSS